MTDLTEGKKFCRVSQTWMDPEEYDARREHYEEMAFMRGGNQGELACPMIISDTQPQLMSMTNGKHYDSKSQMRKEYKRAGVEECGNDVPMKRREKTRYEKDKIKMERKGAVHRAFSKMGFGAP